MTRNFKAIGLALIAAFAMSAVMAAGAQAENGIIKGDTGEENVFLTGTATTDQLFNGALGDVTCGKTSVFEGTGKNGDTDIKVTPTYKGCTTKILGTDFSTTIDHTDCYYTFTGGNGTTVHHFKGITVSLICPTGTGIHIKVYTSAAHTTLRCEFTVTPFTDKSSITAENNTSGAVKDVDVVATVPNVAVEKTSGSFLQCGGTNSTSDYTGSVTLRAYKNAAHTEQTSLTLTDVG